MCNQQDYYGRTAFLSASYNGRLDIVQFMLEDARTDINKISNRGWSPLMNDCYNVHGHLLKYLLAFWQKNQLGLCKCQRF